MPKYLTPDSNQNVLRTSDGTLVRCLYITNIPLNTNNYMQKMEEELLVTLGHFGEIRQFYCKKNDRSKKTTYAFVTYETPEEARRMYCARAQLKYKGRKLYVSMADSWHQPIVKPDGTVIFHRGKNTEEALAQNGLLGQGSKKEGDNEEESEEEEEQAMEPYMNIVQDCPIAKLNDDCILLILEFIPFGQRHVFSHVCRRWRNLMLIYWSRITELNFNTKPFNQVEYSEKRLELYLRLCPAITSVHITNKNTFAYITSGFPSSQSIVKAATLCPQLTDLTITGIEITGRPLAAVAHCCKHLKSLTIKTCKFHERDNEMNTIMRKCRELEKLKLTNCNLTPGHWLRNLPKGLKTLSLLCCAMNNTSFILGLNNLKDSLEELDLVSDTSSDPLDFTKLHEFKLLNRLTYVNRSIHPQTVFIDMFKNFKYLELEFNNFLTDELINGLVEHSPGLSTLSIASSKNSLLTSEGYKAVANLKELVKLNISMNNIEDEVLIVLAEKCSNLEVLSANLCHNVSDVGCKRIVQKLMKLKQLHIDSCSKVTHKTVEAAVEAASHNPEKAKLTIFAAETGIKEVQNQPHPLVELSMSSHSDMNWLLCGSLQDFSDYFFDDDLTDEDEDDDYDYDIYDEEDIYNYPYHSDDELDFNIDDLDVVNPFNIYFEYL